VVAISVPDPERKSRRSGSWRCRLRRRPAGDRPLKGGIAAACGGALRAPLTGRSPPGLGSASGLSLAGRFAPAA